MGDWPTFPVPPGIYPGPGGGGGSITTIASDGSLNITDPTGPTTTLAVADPPVFGYVPNTGTSITDNGAAINSYLATLATSGFTGITPDILPPGLLLVQSPIVIPPGITLNASGRGFSGGNETGTILQPASGGLVGGTFTLSSIVGAPTVNALVTLGVNSGIMNMCVDALLYSAGNAAPIAVYYASIKARIWNCLIAGGSLASLYGDLGGRTFNIGFSDIDPSSGTNTYITDSQAYAWVHLDTDLISTSVRTLSGAKVFNGGGAMHGGSCHYNGASGQAANQPGGGEVVGGPGYPVTANTYDGGGQTFSGVYFDSCDPTSNCWIDRTGAATPSSYGNVKFYNNTHGISGIPIFLETTVSAGGMIVDGMVVTSYGLNYFTYLVSAMTTATVVKNVSLGHEVVADGPTSNPSVGKLEGIVVATSSTAASLYSFGPQYAPGGNTLTQAAWQFVHLSSSTGTATAGQWIVADCTAAASSIVVDLPASPAIDGPVRVEAQTLGGGNVDTVTVQTTDGSTITWGGTVFTGSTGVALTQLGQVVQFDWDSTDSTWRAS